MRFYSRIGSVHTRRIPANWPQPRHLGRTDISLDPLTDANACTAVQYEKQDRWRAIIPIDGMREALEGHASRKGFMLQPFDIDVVAKTVNGKPTAMTVTWL